MEATLSQILDAREQRAAHQRQLLARFHCPIVCFTMNIPGPTKDSPLIREGFRLGDRLLCSQLQGSGFTLAHRNILHAVTGPQGFYAVEAEPLQLKALTAEVEDSLPVGRLFDMDVLTPDGSKCSRTDLGLPPRRCLICQQDARVCGRSRTHSVAQLQEKTEALLREAVNTDISREIAALAVQSLLWEVCTTPKPGLVDCYNSGSHRDMDIFTFTASAAALQPYFEDCVRIGLNSAHLPPEETFRRLRLPGKAAEQAMYRATGGVNTHKGAIFSLGILCGAAGRTSIRQPDTILSQCKAMTQGITRELSEGPVQTTGQRLYLQHGIRGVRGQAEAGFPAVRTGLRILEDGLARGMGINDAGCAALLHMLAQTEDTNLLARSDPDTYQAVTASVKELLIRDPFPSTAVLAAMDAEFIRQNLSPGGSADLLAMTYFVHLLSKHDQ